MMRRYLVIVLVIILVVGLMASVTSNVILYHSYQQEGDSSDKLLSARATRIRGLEEELGGEQTALRGAERQLQALEEAYQSLSDQSAGQQMRIATLEAAIASPPRPTRTPYPRPQLFVTIPASGDRFQEGDEVTVSWNVVSQDGVRLVSLEVDGHQVGERRLANSPLSAEGVLSWQAEGVGEHRLRVIATGASGNESMPVTISIEVIAAQDSAVPSAVDDQNAVIMEDVGQVVVQLRGLEPLRPVSQTLMSEDELAQYVLDEFEREYSAEEARQDVVEMAAFDLLPLDTDLEELLRALYTEEIAGFYDPTTQSLHVISGGSVMGPLEKATFAHEYVHALQDQHYGFDMLDPEGNNDDSSLAVTALTEGDATLLMQEYVMTAMDSDELFELLSQSLEAENGFLETMPPVIQAQFMFPYEAGLEFAGSLHEQGGYEAIDVALQDPPQSTEQILHPEKYLAQEAPQLVSLPPLTDTLGAGWRWIDGDVLGEFFLRLYLEGQLPQREAEAGAEGWGGDRYAVHQHEESSGIVMVMRTVWDSVDEAAEFVGFYQRYGARRFQAEAEATDTAACWSGADSICITASGAETLIIRAPDLEMIRRLELLFPDFSR